MILTLLVFCSDRLAGGGPLSRFGWARLLVHGGRLFGVLLLLLLALHSLILLLRISLRILSSCCSRCSCFSSWLELLSSWAHVDNLDGLADVELSLHDGGIVLHQVAHRLTVAVAALCARMLLLLHVGGLRFNFLSFI